MYLTLHQHLSLPSIETALVRAEHQHEKRSSIGGSAEKLTIDLSQVEFIEPSGLVMAVLLLEDSLRNGTNVVIRTPLQQLAGGERRVIEQAENSGTPSSLRLAQSTLARLRRRQDALKRLGIWQFWSALTADHMKRQKGTIDLDRSHDWSDGSSDEQDLGQEKRVVNTYPETREFTYRAIVPLTWIGDPTISENRDRLVNTSRGNMLGFLKWVLGPQAARGISAPDADTLAHVFLFELAENVHAHAGVPYGLLAVWVRQPIRVSPRAFNTILSKDYMPSERSFITWGLPFPIVEIVVGDSGAGIPAVLGPEFKKLRLNQWKDQSSTANLADALGFMPDSRPNETHETLAWSLDRWSSTSLHGLKRGTRGLYRVLRTVRKWEGQLTIRAEREMITVECKRADVRSMPEKQHLAKVPGTLVHLRIPVKPLGETIRLATVPDVQVPNFTVINLDAAPDIRNAIAKTTDRAMRFSETHPGLRYPYGVIVDVGFRPMNRHELDLLLAGMTEIAHPCVLLMTK